MQTPKPEQRASYHRLFVAIDLPRELCEELQRFFEDSRSLWPKSHEWRRARPEQLHFTLKFLGSTASVLVPEVERALAELNRRIVPFPVSLQSHISQFRGAQGMRVAWIGVEAQPAFGELAAELDLALETLGFASERRPYQAHLTLARGRPRRRGAPAPDFRRLDSALAERHARLTVSWLADALVLYESFTKPEGAHYRELRRVSFPAAHTQERQTGP